MITEQTLNSGITTYRLALASLRRAVNDEADALIRLADGEEMPLNRVPGAAANALARAAELRLMIQLRRATARQFVEDSEMPGGSDF